MKKPRGCLTSFAVISLLPLVLACEHIPGTHRDRYSLVSETTATYVPDRARKKLGVGETVVLTVRPKPVTEPGWKLEGLGSLSSSEGVTVTFTAGDRASEPRISTLIGDSTYTITYQVVEPTHETSYKKREVLPIDNHYAGAKMRIGIVVHPTDVSFHNVEVAELGGGPTNVSGYFAALGEEKLSHKPESWIRLNVANRSTDLACIENLMEPWSSGGFEWIIPVRWRVIGSKYEGELPDVVQKVSMAGPSGVVTVTKLQESVTRSPRSAVRPGRAKQKCETKPQTSPLVLAATFGLAMQIHNVGALAATGEPLREEIAQLERSWSASSGAQQYRYFVEANSIASGLFEQDRDEADAGALLLLRNLFAKNTRSVEVGAADLVAESKVGRFILANRARTSELRLQQSETLAELLKRIRGEFLADYVPKEVYMNVAPPSGDGPSIAGMSPEAIADPVARDRYRDAILQNQSDNLTNARQAELLSMDREFSKPILDHIRRQAVAGEIAEKVVQRLLAAPGFSRDEREGLRSAVQDARRFAGR
jgi:hypothetical protein